MKKFLNDPFDFVDELTEGILAAYPDVYKAVNGDLRVIVRADGPVRGKVAIATGGGSGHLPVFMGYVGKGLADGAAIGNVFSSPSTGQMLRVTRAIHAGEGVLYLYGRYQGDMMNFDAAAQEARASGIEVESVVVTDDVASAPPEKWNMRRGVAGIVFAYKIAGAKADEGATLKEVRVTTQRTVQMTRSIGVALGACTLPAIGKPNFTIADDEMEIGMGIHGEPGIYRAPMRPADEIARVMVDTILADGLIGQGDEVALLMNSLGATPLEELYILYRKAAQLLKDKKIPIYRPFVGRFACSMEMQGASLSMLKMDDEFKRLLDAPCNSPFFSVV